MRNSQRFPTFQRNTSHKPEMMNRYPYDKDNAFYNRNIAQTGGMDEFQNRNNRYNYCQNHK